MMNNMLIRLMMVCVVVPCCIVFGSCINLEGSIGNGKQEHQASGNRLEDAETGSMLTCEESQSAGDLRTWWQLWLDRQDQDYIFRKVSNVYDPYEGTIHVEVTTLGTYRNCVSAAQDSRLISCWGIDSAFFYTALVQTTLIPLGGTDVITTNDFQLTTQVAGPDDRTTWSFREPTQINPSPECWASGESRIQVEPDPCEDTSGLDRLVELVNQAHYNYSDFRSISTEFDYLDLLNERNFPGRPTRTACYGVEPDLLLPNSEVHNEQLGPESIGALLQSFASAAGIEEGSTELAAGIEALACRADGKRFISCQLGFAPDPWSGITQIFFVAADGSFQILFSSQWAE